MDSLSLGFLVVIALSSLVQAVLLLALARGASLLARRLGELQGQIERDFRPVLRNVAHISRNVAEVSDRFALQARRLDLAFAETLERVEAVRDQVRRFLQSPGGLFAEMAAAIRGFRQGFDVYRRLGQSEVQRGGRNRRYREDEHLFIG
jgi:hypothetical protein